MRMGLRVWQPFSGFKPFNHKFDEMFEEALGSLFPVRDEESKGSTTRPNVDIYETDESYVLNVDLPGVNKEDIKIDLNDNHLTVKAEKKFEDKVSKENYVRIERSHGTFLRSFSLSENVDGKNVKASYNDGVLEVTLPKRKQAKTKQIEVN